MAEAYTVLMTLALADPTVAGIIGDRFGPHPLPQKQDGVTHVPAVTFGRLTNTRVESDNAASNAASPMWTLNCWAETYNEVYALAQALRKALDKQNGIIAATTVKRIVYRGGGADLVHPDNGYRVIPQDYQVILEED